MGFQLRLPALKQSLFSLGHVFSKHFYSLSFGLCNKSLSDVVQRICLCLTSAGPEHLRELLCVFCISLSHLTYQNLKVDEVIWHSAVILQDLLGG